MIAPERRHGGTGSIEGESASCKACYPLLVPYKHSGSTEIITPRRFRFGVTSNGVRLRRRFAHLRRRRSRIALASCSQSLVALSVAILAMWKQKTLFSRAPWQWQVSPPMPRSPRAPRNCIPARRRTPPRPPNLPKRPRPGPQRLPPTSTPPSTLPARAIGEKAAAAGDGAGRGGAGRSGGGGNGGRGRPRGGRRTGGGGPRHPESQSEEEETFGAQLMIHGTRSESKH